MCLHRDRRCDYNRGRPRFMTRQPLKRPPFSHAPLTIPRVVWSWPPFSFPPPSPRCPMGPPRRALAVGALALMAGALCFSAASAAAAAAPASPYPAVELTPSVMLLGEFDWVPEYPGAKSSRCGSMRQGCDGVRRRGQRGLDMGDRSKPMQLHILSMQYCALSTVHTGVPTWLTEPSSTAARGSTSSQVGMAQLREFLSLNCAPRPIVLLCLALWHSCSHQRHPDGFVMRPPAPRGNLALKAELFKADSIPAVPCHAAMQHQQPTTTARIPRASTATGAMPRLQGV